MATLGAWAAISRMGPKICPSDLLSRRCQAIIGRDATAVGEVGDLVVAAAVAVGCDRHDGNRILPQFREAYGQSWEKVRRARFNHAVNALRYRYVAWRAVLVSSGPDKDHFFLRALLNHSGDHRLERLAQFLFAVVLDNPWDAEAHVQEVDALGSGLPCEYFSEGLRKVFGLFR